LFPPENSFTATPIISSRHPPVRTPGGKDPRVCVVAVCTANHILSHFKNFFKRFFKFFSKS